MPILRHLTPAAAYAIGLLLALAGCSDNSVRHDFKEIPFGTSDALVSRADTRLTTATPVRANGYHEISGITPARVLCAEPSPDVAKAVSSSLNIGSAIDFKALPPNVPAEVAAQIAASVSRSRAEAMAQLTARLATIQLLRDGLYHLCEAYGNGAINQMEYALVLSRFGDTMITMLGSELVAGNFGQQLAALGTSATGSSQAAIKQAVQDATKVQADQQHVKDLQTQIDQKEAAQKQAGIDLNAEQDDTKRAPLLADYNNKTQDLADLRKQLADAQLQLSGDKATAAVSAAYANTLMPVGSLSGQKPDNGVAQVIENMQRSYLNAPNLNALMVACIIALDRKPTSATPYPDTLFASKCNSEFMREIVATQQSAINAALPHEEAGVEARALREATRRVAAARDAIAALEKKPAPSAGSSGAATVKEAQDALRSAGLYNGKSDGIMGPATKKALSEYQQKNGLKVTGQLDPTTLGKMGIK